MDYYKCRECEITTSNIVSRLILLFCTIIYNTNYIHAKHSNHSGIRIQFNYYKSN